MPIEIPAHRAWTKPPTEAEVQALEDGKSPPKDRNVPDDGVAVAVGSAPTSGSGLLEEE